jgi:hypothetical protein
MKLNSAGTLFALLVFVNASAEAQQAVHVSTVETRLLAQACDATAGKDPLDANVCTGYLLGSFDQMSFAHLICPPDGFSTQQAMAIGRKYLKDNPEKWHLHPAFLLREAFSGSFPCRR